MVGELIQILLAIGIVVILFVIAFYVYNKEMVSFMNDASRTKIEVPIFTGILDFQASSNISYNTQNKSSANYKNIVPSYNQKAGAEFTYNFWLFTNFGDEYPVPEESELVAVDPGLSSDDLILFLKGSKTAQTYKSVCGQIDINGPMKKDILVKCPLVKLQRGGDVLTVEFNTASHPDGVREKSRNVCDDQSIDWSYMNAHKLAVTGLRTGPNASNYSDKWYMVTIIIQDTNPSDPLPIRNKCRCRIYVNGTLELDRYVDGALNSDALGAESVLQTNQGDLHFAPSVMVNETTTTKVIQTPRKMMMADLTYYNYAIDPSTIAAKFKDQFNKSFAPVTTVPADDPTVGASITSVANVSDKRQLTAL